MSDEGFISRWSRRKTQVSAGVAVPAEPPAAEAAPAPVAPSQAEPEPPVTEAPAPPPPTLDDVAQLTPGSDFSRFVARDVDPSVKNAALKKLFADPHFNVMDGLDTYIDDYSQPDPLPQSMLRQMAQAQFLGLFEDDTQTAPPKASPDGSAAPAVPQSPVEPFPAVPPDEDPDLRLQQDDAAGPRGAVEGPPA